MGLNFDTTGTLLVYVVAGTILNVVYFNQAFGALIDQSDFIMSVCNAATAKHSMANLSWNLERRYFVQMMNCLRISSFHFFFQILATIKQQLYRINNMNFKNKTIDLWIGKQNSRLYLNHVSNIFRRLIWNVKVSPLYLRLRYLFSMVNKKTGCRSTAQLSMC